MRKDVRVYLAHVLERLQKIERFTVEGREAFFRSEVIQDAVLRNLEVIGEATKRIDSQYRAAHPEVPWRRMAALRDVLIHAYEEVDLGQVWSVVEVHVPQLKQALEALLPPLDQLEREVSGEGEGAP